jgi:hypothetical protein
MPRFEVYCGNTLIGWTDLESGDAPMGVALGRLIPSSDYASMRSATLQGLLTIRVAGGECLTPQIVHIDDYSAELGPEGLQISALGIRYPAYAQLFPHHVRAYEQQFKDHKPPKGAT